jgi:hypothetical protein
VDCLGRTIQDAVTACLRLGYQFLWVDSLCIVQDSDEDRANELGRMTTIYTNADVTTSAALAPSYDTGFLKAPPPVHASRPFLLPSRLPDGQTGKICVYEQSSGMFGTNWPPAGQRRSESERGPCRSTSCPDDFLSSSSTCCGYAMNLSAITEAGSQRNHTSVTRAGRPRMLRAIRHIGVLGDRCHLCRMACDYQVQNLSLMRRQSR